MALGGDFLLKGIGLRFDQGGDLDPHLVGGESSAHPEQLSAIRPVAEGVPGELLAMGKSQGPGDDAECSGVSLGYREAPQRELSRQRGSGRIAGGSEPVGSCRDRRAGSSAR